MMEEKKRDGQKRRASEKKTEGEIRPKEWATKRKTKREMNKS